MDEFLKIFCCNCDKPYTETTFEEKVAIKHTDGQKYYVCVPCSILPLEQVQSNINIALNKSKK